MPRPSLAAGRITLPDVPGVLTASQARATGLAIAAMQEPSGQIPWFPGGHTDPWDHVESAMGLTVAGLPDEAEAAYLWLRATQRADGSWPMRWRGATIENPDTDTNFCAYPAVGVWHHLLVTGRRAFAVRMWPTVRRAINMALEMQAPSGEFYWARGADGQPVREALLTGNASIHLSLHCALQLARELDAPQPAWEIALGRLRHALRRHPEAFSPKPEFSMDWYYPVLGGAVRGRLARERLEQRWEDFVVDGLGIRCVDHQPWVTGAETCELSLALTAIGDTGRARELLAAMQHLRDPDGAYWTGLVFTDGKRWPVEKSSWTSAVMLLAADALSGATAGSALFTDAGVGSEGHDDRDVDCRAPCYAGSAPG